MRGCVGRCRRWLWAVGEMDLSRLGLSRVFWRVSWSVLACPGVSRCVLAWRVERPGAAHNWTDLAAPLPCAVWSPTSGASTSVGHGWVSSPSPPSLQISTHTVDSQPTHRPLHLLSATQRARLHHLFNACFVSPASCLSAENPALSRNCIGRRAVLPPAPRSLSPPF